ncbi:ABC-2 type transport system permease protein [Paenibacillus catalpae]|uniref:ABC-2 type transport system permease protein n=1 Tax=Paenibacillus catalpae TaxID=1045775 RepID=A0A1I1YR31_9BACL|nr:ABC transporter permease subunit [Paenibacillus catalpae]SFE22054.1 ABC-2 type transport system permease protein [Paenibacillus catalpae]
MIFRREIVRNLKPLLIWSGIIGGLILLTLAVFPQMAKQQETVGAMIDSLPDAMKKAFGMDRLGMDSLIGYYGIRVYLMPTLVGSIYAAILAGNIVAKESAEKTIEFLLSKPVTRFQVIGQKLLAVIVNLIILNTIIVLAALAGFQFAETSDVSPGTFLLLTLATFFLHLTFASIAFLLSSALRRTRNITSTSLGIVLFSYFLNVISAMSEDLALIKHFSFFHYIDAADIITTNGIDSKYIIVMVSIVIICLATAFSYFKKRDITV